MKPTILLTGKTGQLGSELNRLLPQLGQVIAPDRNEMDLGEPEKILQIIRSAKPELVVNTAGYTAVDTAETDEANALAVNGEAPRLLALEAKKLGALLVHFSTDYVFDGSKKTPYVETDPPHPLNVYGKTKLEGEQGIRNSGTAHLIFRTSWVYATHGRNFLLTILRLATEREELKIVADQIGAPTCATDIATATSKILSNIYDDASAFSNVSGTYHMTAAGETTWYEFTKAILEEAANASQDVSWFSAATQGRPLLARRTIPITGAEYGSRTPRPAYSVLSNSLLTQTFGMTLPNWRTQLHQCFADRQFERMS
jgi:dTDP-4-dehydrorhamnose reductase